MMYDLKKRIKGGKWLTVATWACPPDTCLRQAELMFISRGFTVNHDQCAYWSRTLRQQKNWAGFADNCRHLDQVGKEIV